MIHTARNCGATAKFAGSGGAIVGTYKDEFMFRRLCEGMQPIGVSVIKPKITLPVNPVMGD